MNSYTHFLKSNLMRPIGVGRARLLVLMDFLSCFLVLWQLLCEMGGLDLYDGLMAKVEKLTRASLSHFRGHDRFGLLCIVVALRALRLVLWMTDTPPLTMSSMPCPWTTRPCPARTSTVDGSVARRGPSAGDGRDVNMGNGPHPETAFNAEQTGRHVAWSRAGCAAAAWTTSPSGGPRCAQSLAIACGPLPVASVAWLVAARLGVLLLRPNEPVEATSAPLLEFVIASRLAIHSRPICHGATAADASACVRPAAAFRRRARSCFVVPG
jgi:hypothetical protein